uniref:Heat shock factor-binding protein 1-like n=1 Tax=Ditylum brightwellii TaxID=49249 RepID=A0A7S4SCG2_9STRA|mmetsp:Transcript_33540/g.44771  ORF Transcript_33540/g.44771 Transcript_33540/m.44771 type:complete len:123 (+) Transcript_33540:195-563(+)
MEEGTSSDTIEATSLASVEKNKSLSVKTTQDGASGGSSDPQDLSVFVEDLLEQMQKRFSHMGDSIIGRIDEMGDRIEDLEKSVSDLMERAGVDPPPIAPSGGGGVVCEGSFQTPPASPQGKS